ncbi:MAG: gentisate 1,2-dioxygenase [Alphaproteobacteria bacterium]|nr:gentisate 1,2-dioxygenase [Alphaproteobacteria bacterium]
MSRALDAKPETTNARADYYGRIDKFHMAPLWEVLHKLLSHEPVTQASPHVWHYDKLRGHLLESADQISAAEAERRVLVLENPTMRGESRITEALYAGLQLIMPGEIAPAHRHSPSALRFIVEGTGAYTAINGEKAYMERGDLILTPSWVWHDHGHHGDVPVVWLDGLDIPLVRYLGPVFAEPYPAESFPPGHEAGDNIARYGVNMLPFGAQVPSQHSPIFHYRYAETRSALERLARSRDQDACHGVKMEYVSPATGGPVMATISTYMQRLPKGFHGATYQSTAAWVYNVVEGHGKTIVGDTVLTWGPRDVFVVPAWCHHHHKADSDSYLFSFSDLPIQKKLGLYRERRGDA